MQPQEPPTGPANPPETEATQRPAEKPTSRRRRARLWVAVAAGVLGILCVGGVGVAVLLYDKETKIDRGKPDVVADRFLIAYLVNRDDKEANLFTCDAPNLAEIGLLREQIAAREEDFGVRVSVSWGALVRTVVGDDQEDVSTELTISGSSGGRITSSRTESWHLRIVGEDGEWRVCGASKVS